MDVEVARALERHKRKEAVLVLIILRPVLWQVIPRLKELPSCQRMRCRLFNGRRETWRM
jgi:hypothetical protein